MQKELLNLPNLVPKTMSPLWTLLPMWGICRVCYRIAFWSDRKHPTDDLDLSTISGTPERKQEMRELISKMRAIEPTEEVEITSFDGLRLRGRYYKRNENAPLYICFHGYKGTACRDFSGGGQMVLENDSNLLLIDERAQGKSEGRSMTFGIRERFDVISWIVYAEQHFKQNGIILCGISMGATAVLMASEMVLPDSVKGIIADCPYNKPSDIIMSVAKKQFHLPEWTMLFVKASARMFAGIRLDETSAAEAVKRTKVPIMIIHGLEDTLVPEYFSREIAETNPAMIERHTFAGAEHGLSYYADMERYKKLYRDFVEKCMRG